MVTVCRETTARRWWWCADQLGPHLLDDADQPALLLSAIETAVPATGTGQTSLLVAVRLTAGLSPCGP